MKLSRAQEKQKTIDKILSTSLRLYNKEGVHSVSMHFVAERLGISPGHLTYHFKKKNDIIHALVDKLEEAVKTALGGAKEAGAVMEEHAKIMIQFIEVSWNYRFFFNNIVYLANKDPAQKDRYLSIKATVVQVLSEGHQKLVENGSIIPADEGDGVEALLGNIWYLMLSQLRLYLVETPVEKQSLKGYSRFSSKHLYALLSPYYSQSVRAGYREFLERQFA